MGNKLEEVAIEARKQLLTKNTFNDDAKSNNYSATHTNALSDETTPANGKGTGVSFDTANGGSHHDIYGVAHAVGSGRLGNVIKNEFAQDKPYVHPDTSGNIGQVAI